MLKILNVVEDSKRFPGFSVLQWILDIFIGFEYY